MDTPRIQSNINKLRDDVEQYTEKTKPNKYLEKIYTSSPTLKIYVAIPIVILLILSFFHPDFVKHEHTDERGNVVKKISYVKVIVWWLVLSGIFIVGFYGYNYKMSKNDAEQEEEV
jgi:hypothetical protein